MNIQDYIKISNAPAIKLSWFNEYEFSVLSYIIPNNKILFNLYKLYNFNVRAGYFGDDLNIRYDGSFNEIDDIDPIKFWDVDYIEPVRNRRLFGINAIRFLCSMCKEEFYIDNVTIDMDNMEVIS